MQKGSVRKLHQRAAGKVWWEQDKAEGGNLWRLPEQSVWLHSQTATDSWSQRGTLMSVCNFNNINHVSLTEGCSSYFFNWQVDKLYLQVTSTSSPQKNSVCYAVWSWSEWGHAGLCIQENIKQMQIIKHLHDINSEKDKFCLMPIGGDMGDILLSLWTSSFHFLLYTARE